MIASPTSSLPTSLTTIKKKNSRGRELEHYESSGTNFYYEWTNSIHTSFQFRKYIYHVNLPIIVKRFLPYYHQTITSHYNLSSDLLEHAQ